MDLEQIKALIDLMVEHDLSRIEIDEGESRVLLKRGQTPIISGSHALPAALPPVVASTAAPTGAPPASEAAAATAAEAAANETLIRSPMVGTFYTAADPDSPPFVNAGADVNPNTVVCLIEAMKVFNEIKAEISGRVTRVLVGNGQAVEYDQPLFAVESA